MDNKILYLKRSLIVEIIFGALLAIILSVYMVSMASANPNAATIDIFLGALFPIVIVALPLVLLPYMAIRELNEYEEQNSLILNYVNSGIAVGFVFFPLAVWQIFTLVKVKSYRLKEKKA
ncbi:hypothetical protein GCM10007916_12060 [Psychromonas marina]|uniref:Uncharacterized protein n=1 Tax=Psychromonas marina TaxID=88364 RepID=A0ABQ6DY91_9GAMM|nr:hypothetical protein [Psychromonas marina]GLS90139.1 hypothetical protein GCM10007916_12060 [Psychromonas marina]